MAGAKGAMAVVDEPVGSSESMLTLVRDLQNYPKVLEARLRLERWRFYHSVRTDAEAPARNPVRGYWSTVLAEDRADFLCARRDYRRARAGIAQSNGMLAAVTILLAQLVDHAAVAPLPAIEMSLPKARQHLLSGSLTHRYRLGLPVTFFMRQQVNNMFFV